MKLTTITLCLLIAITLAERGDAMNGESKNDNGLRAELRGNENGRILFTTEPRLENRMHFLLYSSQDHLHVYRQDNSWGESCRSFTLKEEYKPNMVYHIQRRYQEYVRNAPLTRELNKGDFLITEVNFCDGSWRIEPAFPEQRSARLLVTGQFEIKEKGINAWGDPVWTGRIESNTIEVGIEPDCWSLLNDPSP